MYFILASSSKILTKVPLERSQNISKSHFPTESCMSIKSNVSKEEITNTISQDTSDKMHSNISTSGRDTIITLSFR